MKIMAATFETEDSSVVEFQLGNKQLFLLFVGLLVICAIFFFIGLKVGEDTAKSRVPISLTDNNAAGQTANDSAAKSNDQLTMNVQPLSSSKAGEAKKSVQKPNRNVSSNNRKTGNVNSKPARKNNTAAKRKETTPAKKESSRSTAKNTTAKNTINSSGAISSGRYYVQVAAQRDINSARKIQGRLPASLQTTIEQISVKGTMYFRVLIGPYSEKAKAEGARQAVLSSFKEAFIKKY